jgi:hypothetical protein
MLAPASLVQVKNFILAMFVKIVLGGIFRDYILVNILIRPNFAVNSLKKHPTKLNQELDVEIEYRWNLGYLASIFGPPLLGQVKLSTNR